MLLLPSQQDRARILSASPIAASSRRHADHPTTAPNVAREARPGEVARVPAAGVANVDAVLVVPDDHEPVALTKRMSAVSAWIVWSRSCAAHVFTTMPSVVRPYSG